MIDRKEVEALPCAHENTTTRYDCVTCGDCGGIRTDSRWGIASNTWFASRGEAQHYRQTGRLPDPVPRVRLLPAGPDGGSDG